MILFIVEAPHNGGDDEDKIFYGPMTDEELHTFMMDGNKGTTLDEASNPFSWKIWALTDPPEMVG